MCVCGAVVRGQTICGGDSADDPTLPHRGGRAQFGYTGWQGHERAAWGHGPGIMADLCRDHDEQKAPEFMYNLCYCWDGVLTLKYVRVVRIEYT